MRELTELQEMSNRYGRDPEYVLAGGGNTSFKDGATLYVKGSGTSLATIKAEDFVRLSRAKLDAMWDRNYSDDEAKRESEVLADMMLARAEGETKRPSVETLLHNLFPQRFVLHVHPALINGMTCGACGKQIAAELFPDSVWIDACRPGYILASICRKALAFYREATGKDASLLFLQNHGVFFAADTTEAVDRLVGDTMSTLRTYADGYEECLRSLLGKASGSEFVYFADFADAAFLDPDSNSPTPDHIVYCKASYLRAPRGVTPEQLSVLVKEFTDKNGYRPRVIIIEGEAVMLCADDQKTLDTVKAVFQDHCRVARNSVAFGGYLPMTDDLRDFIVNWEVESYRAKQNG